MAWGEDDVPEVDWDALAEAWGVLTAGLRQAWDTISGYAQSVVEAFQAWIAAWAAPIPAEPLRSEMAAWRRTHRARRR